MNTLTQKRQQLKKVAAAVKLIYIGYTTKFDIEPIFKGRAANAVRPLFAVFLQQRGGVRDFPFCFRQAH